MPLIVRGAAANQFRGVVVVPIEPETDVRALDEVIGMGGGANALEGQARVYAAKGTTAELMQAMSASQPRPDLSIALGDGPDAPVRLVVMPEMIPQALSFPRIFGVGRCAEPQWKSVHWCRLALTPPPNAALTLSFRCDDARSATAFAELLRAKFTGRLNETLHGPTDIVCAKRVSNLEPVADRDRVTVQLDQPATEAVLVSWFWHDVYDSHKAPQPAQRK
jgi:hypothetical protein